MARQDDDRAKNRDQEMRPGAAAHSARTRPDPATGELRPRPPAGARWPAEDAPPHPRNGP